MSLDISLGLINPNSTRLNNPEFTLKRTGLEFGKGGFQKFPDGGQYGAVRAKDHDSMGRRWREAQGVGIVQVQGDKDMPRFYALPIDHLIRLS